MDNSVPSRELASALDHDGVSVAPASPSAPFLAGALAGLPHGHADIVAKAVSHVRVLYAEVPDAGRLLVEPFTLRDLRELHGAVAGSL
ncbi:hypothetical protein ACQCSX_14225 [Pseudarthrobacter sp. P1]|uniref:hypothetical protein n=1 Tax=Pseudarthrobacter sp. P1 TaxID=3418418 RepID=UPI003CF441DE